MSINLNYKCIGWFKEGVEMREGGSLSAVDVNYDASRQLECPVPALVHSSVPRHRCTAGLRHANGHSCDTGRLTLPCLIPHYEHMDFEGRSGKGCCQFDSDATPPHYTTSQTRNHVITSSTTPALLLVGGR